MAAVADPPEAPGKRVISPAERVALQQAGQYAGLATPLTPENAESVGLDPERGFVSRGAPTETESAGKPMLPILKQILETKVPGVPPLWQTQPENTQGTWNPAPELKEELLTKVPGTTPAKKEITPESLGQKQVPETDKAKSETNTVTPESLGQKQVPETEQKTGPETTAVTPESLGQKQVPDAEPPPRPQPTTSVAAASAGAPPGGVPATPQQPEKPAEPQAQPTADDRDAKIQTLIQAGKTPGEAQAIVDGQEPKTVTGEKPPAPKQVEEQAKPPELPAAPKPTVVAVLGGPKSEQQDRTTPEPAPADTTGVADFFRKRKDQPITSSNDPRLTTVSAGGQHWQVNKEAAPAFQGFVSELASKGAPITLGTGGGWAYREKVGAKGISEHAYGGAIDVNQLPGQRNKVTPEFQKWIAANPGLLQQIERHWNIYGGERFGDLGHFEWGGVPISTTKTAATTSAATPSAALGPDDLKAATQLDKHLGGLLHGKGNVYIAMGKKYGVDPRLLAAISIEETGNGTSHLLRTRNNVGGITGKGHTGVGGDYVPYNSIEEGIEAEASLLRHGYVGQGLDTIDKIGAKWAPPDAANDPNKTNREWPDAVRKFYAALGGTGKLGETSGKYPTFAGSSATGPTGGPGLASQPMVSIPSAGGTPQLSGKGPRGGGWSGDSGYAGGSEATPRTADAGPVNLTSLLEAAAGGAAVGSLFGGRGQQAKQEEEPWTGTGGTVGGAPPAAPGGATQLPPPPSGQGFAQAKPANVLSVTTPPPAPSAPKALPAGVDPSVIKGLMKQGFTLEQANAFAAKALVSKPGKAAITGGATFRPQAKEAPRLPPPPPKATPAAPPPPRAPTPFQPGRGTTGVPNPPGSEALKNLPLAQASKQHAALLSPDDPRVKKQADGKIKGEHFVPGDDFHEQLLNGLPGGQKGRQRQILAQAETAIADKTPLHISYLSSPKEAALYPTRESRTVQYEAHSPEARLMGTTEGQLVGHSMIPVSVGITPASKKGEPHESVIHGLSTNVLANNFQHINTKLAAMGRKTPYATFGAKFSNDLEGYLHNLNAGHTGTGRGIAVGTAEHPSEPDTAHVPYRLTRHEADFLNAVINNTAAFAKHEDGQKLRELARANGTLLTEAGETNRLRNEIEQHEPGWRNRVLEPSIRSFKTGLIHDVHPSEEHMPATIRPGQDYQDLTKAMERTSYRGRPDVGIAASLHHTFADNKAINRIERDFSEERISEEEAKQRLLALGEDPDEFRFIGGSGGLITPYEENPEAITPQEHNQLKDNLRKQWIGGKMDVENYRKKAAEVPLPEIPSRPASTQTEPSTPQKEPKPSPAPATTEPEEPETPEETPQTPAAAPKPVIPAPKPKPAPKAPITPAEEPEEAPVEPAPAVTKPAAPEEPPAAPTGKKAVAAPIAEEKLTKPKGVKDPAWMANPRKEKERQDYLEKRVAASLERQNTHPSAIPLKVQRNEKGGVQHDPDLNPVWESTDYNLADTPFLQKNGKGLSQLEGADKHEDTLGKDEHKHLNQVERKRLSAMRKASAVATMGDHIFNSYNKIKDQPDIAAGKGWYSRMREKMAKVFGVGEGGKASEDHELFAQLLGATSAKTPVRDNFIQTLDAFEQYKTGKFDKHIEKYKEAYKAMQDGGYKALNQLMHEQGILKEGDDIPKTDAAAMARWIDHHEIMPRKQNGAKYNSNSEQVLKVLAGHWLGQVGAPKTPNFAGNLTGRTLAATIDVWAARHLHRLGHEHEGEKEGWRPQAAAEPGVNSLDFAFSQDAMKHAADKIGINPDDLQAILWYAEKHHYDKNGWTGAAGAEKGSFDETWDKAFPTEGKAMTSKELQEHYQGEKKKADRLEDIKDTLAGKRSEGKSQEHIEKYMKRHVDPFLEQHGLSRSHLEAPAAPGLEKAA